MRRVIQETEAFNRDTNESKFSRKTGLELFTLEFTKCSAEN